ncbi:MAG: ASCH domain-containing protein [Cyanobacteria bacterium SID2]|nr:ASCH domain-containing protein [Cyanobacteria bacterium SID2]
MIQQKPKVLLLSIKPQYVQKILDGQKTIELRKTRPKIQKGDFILVYESSPSKSLIGWFEVQGIICESPKKLWDKVKNKAGVTKEEFDAYYQKSTLGVGICINSIHCIKMSLEDVRKQWNQFKPPQNFHYLKEEEILLAEQVTDYSLTFKTQDSQIPLSTY